jgi:hypothetical protein
VRHGAWLSEPGSRRANGAKRLAPDWWAASEGGYSHSRGSVLAAALNRGRFGNVTWLSYFGGIMRPSAYPGAEQLPADPFCDSGRGSWQLSRRQQLSAQGDAVGLWATPTPVRKR